MNEQHTYSIVRTFQVLWVAALTFLLSTSSLMALGADHPAKPVGNSSWPKGMKDLVNSKERIHGYFVNAEDVFFFSGDKERFEKFLADYAKIDGLVSHKIVVHAGVGEAKSPW